VLNPVDSDAIPLDADVDSEPTLLLVELSPVDSDVTPLFVELSPVERDVIPLDADVDRDVT
jgi:hypothetical protein